jgi:hypothetical protein
MEDDKKIIVPAERPSKEWYLRMIRWQEEQGIEEPSGIMAISPELHAEMMKANDEALKAEIEKQIEQNKQEDE